MKAGQITAKLRDAVPVCFYTDGNEVTRYKNIDIPDSLKELEIKDFGFDVAEGDKITFRLNFNYGILPAIFPPAREKMTRAEKAAAKATKTEVAANIATTDAATEANTKAVDDGEAAEPVAEVSEPAIEDTADTTDAPADEAAPAIPEYRFNVTGEQRKALAAAIGELIGSSPKYLGAPSFAFGIGTTTLDRNGTLTGELAQELLAALAEQGFIPEAE